MSERTFSRRFSAEVGISPKRWLLAQRVGRARELLETTDLPVEVVADRAGFASGPGAAPAPATSRGDDNRLPTARRSGARLTSVTPDGWRRTPLLPGCTPRLHRQ